MNWCENQWWAHLATGFLNLQIEHHWFPQCPPFAYPEVQPLIAEYCQKNNIEYRCLGFGEACKKMFKGLTDTAREELQLRKQKRADRLAAAEAEGADTKKAK